MFFFTFASITLGFPVLLVLAPGGLSSLPTSPCLSSHLLAKLGEAFASVITGSSFLTCESLPARCPGMEQVYRQSQTGQGRKSTHPTLLFSFEYRKEETSPGELKAFGFDYYCIELRQGTSKQRLVFLF